MANLQDQLGLGLVAKQTAKMNNTPKYSFQSKDALTGGVQISAWIAEPQQIDLGWWPAYYNNSSSRDGGLPIQDSFNQSYSAPASVSTPESTTNMSIADTFSWITRKKNTNIAETIKQVAPVWMQVENPVIPENKLQSFKDATQWQDVQFRQSYRQAMKTPNPIDSSGLSGAELQAYNMLNPQEQAQYKALATQWMKAQTDYLTKSKANIEYQKSQEEQRLAMEDNADAIADIMSQKNIEESQKQVANLKQNIWYLGSGWQPWISSQKLDAISNQVTLADRTLKNIIEVERLQKANRELWQEKNAEIFTRQIKILQDDLDSKVNKTIQWALNQFNSAELEWKLDTIPEIEAFQQQLYAQLDWDLSSIMDTNIEARQFLIERYDKLAESQKAQMQANEKAKADYQKNSNTLNKDMSEALGYYVNNNWEALIDQKTGARIEVPLNTEKVFDQDTGNLMLFTTNKDGTITARMRKVWPSKPVNPEWKQDASGNWYNANSTTNPQFQSIDRQSAIWKYWSTPAIRNFNPWNIMDTWFGWQKIEWERFTVFSSPQEWFNALVAKIQNIQNWWSKVYSPDMTLLQYIGKYAPSSDNNNPQWYANAIANNLGISINTKIGQIDPVKLAEEHARHEDGNSYRMLKDIWIIWWWGTQPTGDLAEDINVKVANIGNIAFGRTMSDAEGKRVESIIKSNPNASVNDIALAVRGLNIKDDADKQIALEYVNIFDKMSDSVKPKTGLEMTISKYINAGDYKWLNDFVTKNVDRQVKADSDSPILTPEYNVGKQRTDKLVGLIKKNKDKIGIVSGNVSDFLQKFEWDKDYQQIKTILQMSQADMRKYFAGSAVTETEMKALADFIGGTTKMAPDNLVTMLKTLDEDRTNTYNAQREWFQIPNINAVQWKQKIEKQAKKQWISSFSLWDLISKLP